MSNLKYQTTDISKINQDRQFFCDANFLIFNFSPYSIDSSSFQIQKYTQLFRDLLKSRKKLVTNFLVISEFVNKVIKNGYDNYDYKNNINFKQFRNSESGKNILKNIYNIIQNDILRSFKIEIKDINKNDIKSFLNEVR